MKKKELELSDPHVKESHLAESSEKHFAPGTLPLSVNPMTGQLIAPIPLVTPSPVVEPRVPEKTELPKKSDAATKKKRS